MKLFKIALMAIFLVSIYSFIEKSDKTSKNSHEKKLINENPPSSYFHVTISYQFGISETQKQIVRNCVTSTRGIIFVNKLPGFASAFGGDVEVWRVQLIGSSGGNNDFIDVSDLNPVITVGSGNGNNVKEEGDTIKGKGNLLLEACESLILLRTID